MAKSTKKPIAKKKNMTKENYYPNKVPWLTTTLGVVTMMLISLMIYSSYV